MNIIVTGGRDYKDHLKVAELLNALRPALIIVGDCTTGVDAFVRKWQIHIPDCVDMFVYEADWKTHGKAAESLRNIEMIETNPDAIVIAFPGGKGTESCVREAKKRGLTVLRVE